jgi:3',5'-cyclic-AMP phosphodiesterase
MSGEPGALRVVHLTDTHIMAGGAWRPRAASFDFDTAASLRRVVAAIGTLDPAPALAVLGGDLASPDLLHRDRALTADDYEPSYRLLQEILAPLPCPAHFLMGNHDNRVAFARVFGAGDGAPEASRHGSFDRAGHHFITLDSLEPGQAGGFLDPAQLAWLERDLAAHRDAPTLAFVHHHPWPLGLRWIDTMTLRNGEELMTRLRTHGRLSHLVCGHVHLDQAIQRDGLTMLTTPSTCVQLSTVSQEPKMLPGPPAFRILDLSADTLSTRVVRLQSDTATDF